MRALREHNSSQDQKSNKKTPTKKTLQQCLLRAEQIKKEETEVDKQKEREWKWE